jgi:mRNA interferase RelE/StbE
VERDLKDLAKAETKKILDRIEKELSRKPEANPTLKGQFAGLRKYRIGDYRVIYALLEDDVLILRIGHRREVYRRKF